ncbi:MAG: class I SAM-dependent methyltransferase [Acidobacteria bacterium]|nr:class I SAM-dependent methyltransferase [Acidobacteriota bacterium]
MKNSAEFYNRIAADYDRMTRFEDKLAVRQSVLRGILERYPAQSVLDIACGTGINAIALARLGIAVTASDIATEMLDQARENARRFQAPVDWIGADMLLLAETVAGRSFEMVLCLGNSIPHLAGPEELRRLCEHMHGLLSPGGVFIVQLLNYDRVLAEGERIVNITRHEDETYIRFYDFLDPHLRFNLLKVAWDGDAVRWQMESTRLYPFRAVEVEVAARKAGFSDRQLFGRLDFSVYESSTAGNIVLVARKQSAGSGIQT